MRLDTALTTARSFLRYFHTIDNSMPMMMPAASQRHRRETPVLSA